MKFFTKEVKIALVAIVAIVVMFFGLNFLKGLSLFSSSSTYYVRFSDVSGLSASSPIYVNGVKMGVVESIDVDYQHPERIVAAVGLDPELRLPQGTKAEISSDLLGNVRLELCLGDINGATLTPGDTIEGGAKSGMMDKAAEMLPQVQQMLPKLDSILLSLNTIIADPAITATLHNTEQLTAQLAAASVDLKRLVATTNGKMPAMMRKADSLLANTQALTANLAALDLQATMSQVDALLTSVRQMTAALNNGEGSLGMLLHDRGLYEHLNATMSDLDALLVDFKANPRRYINVSVFGRKAK